MDVPISRHPKGPKGGQFAPGHKSDHVGKRNLRLEDTTDNRSAEPPLPHLPHRIVPMSKSCKRFARDWSLFQPSTEQEKEFSVEGRRWLKTNDADGLKRYTKTKEAILKSQEPDEKTWWAKREREEKEFHWSLDDPYYGRLLECWHGYPVSKLKTMSYDEVKSRLEQRLDVFDEYLRWIDEYKDKDPGGAEALAQRLRTKLYSRLGAWIRKQHHDAQSETT